MSKGRRRIAALIATLAALCFVAPASLFVVAAAVEIRALSDNLAPGQYPVPASAIDVTDRYDSLIAGSTAVNLDTIRGRLDGVTVVFVPSLMGDTLTAIQALGLAPKTEELAALRSLNLQTVTAPVRSQAPIAENARILADLVRRSDRPLCFLSHSKGGLDTLAALLLLAAEERRRVRCWIALQAPMAGSPVADLRTASAVLQTVADTLISAFGGAARTLDELTTTARRRYLVENDAAIGTLATQSPILMVGTSAGGDDGPTLFIAPLHRWMAGVGIRNDGLVPTHSAILPHTRFVLIDGPDHVSPLDQRRMWALLFLVLTET